MKMNHRLEKILTFLFKVIAVFSICYFVITEYVLYWYLKDHYSSVIGIVVAKENFENGGYTYRYQYVVDGVDYSSTSLSSDSRSAPIIGSKCVVKYLPSWPSVSGPEFDTKPIK